MIGAAGQYIAAVLETAGLYAQSYVLTNFAAFFSSVGGLVLTGAFFAAVVSYAIYGNYTQIRYFLIGPGLFFWMLTNTTTVQSTANQFGDRLLPDNTARMQEVLDGAADGDFSNGAQVSYAFVIFDDLISYVIQKTVRVFVDTAQHEDVISIARARAMSHIVMSRAKDSEFLKFFTLNVVGSCGERFQLAKDLGRLKRDSTGSQVDQNEIARKQASYDALATRPVHLNKQVLDYVNERTGQSLVSPQTCQGVWDNTVTLLKQLAAEEFDNIGPSESENEMFPGMDWEKVKSEVKLALAEGDSGEDRAITVLAAYYLYNTLRFSNYQNFDKTGGSIASQVAGRGDWVGSDYTAIFGEMMNAETAAEQMTIVYFAAVLPYMQGIMLYFLTMAFPFFALFLLVPGKMRAFFVWAHLWVWVKSWDVGFAILHIVREVLWHFLPNAGKSRFANQPGQELFNKIDWNDPASVFNVVYTYDPSNSMATYFMIVSFLTLSVPMFTAYFFNGAQELYGALSVGIDRMARERFGSRRRLMAHNQYKDSERMAVERQEAFGENLGAAMAYNNPGMYNGETLSGGGDRSHEANIKAGAALGRSTGFQNSQTRVSSQRRMGHTGRGMDFKQDDMNTDNSRKQSLFEQENKKNVSGGSPINPYRVYRDKQYERTTKTGNSGDDDASGN